MVMKMSSSASIFFYICHTSAKFKSTAFVTFLVIKNSYDDNGEEVERSHLQTIPRASLSFFCLDHFGSTPSKGTGGFFVRVLLS